MIDDDGWTADFSESDDINYEPLPNGWYEVVVLTAKQETSDKGTRMIAFEFQVLDPAEHSGRKLWLRNTVNGKDKNYYLKRSLVAMGVKVENTATLDGDYLRDLQGCYAAVQAFQETYNGKTRSKVLDIRPSGEGDLIAESLNGDIGF